MLFYLFAILIRPVRSNRRVKNSFGSQCMKKQSIGGLCFPFRQTSSRIFRIFRIRKKTGCVEGKEEEEESRRNFNIKNVEPLLVVAE
jgi:hypothetical protein